jgi:hypothetical protein
MAPVGFVYMLAIRDCFGSVLPDLLLDSSQETVLVGSSPFLPERNQGKLISELRGLVETKYYYAPGHITESQHEPTGNLKGKPRQKMFTLKGSDDEQVEMLLTIDDLDFSRLNGGHRTRLEELFILLKRLITENKKRTASKQDWQKYVHCFLPRNSAPGQID